MSENAPNAAIDPVPRVRWRDLGGLRWLWLAAFVVVLDQITKYAIVRHFALFERAPLLSILELTRLHNRGAAFSFLAAASGWQRYAFIALAAVVCGGLLVWLVRLGSRAPALLGAAIALVMGGALGNVIDRLRLGYVIDFIHFHWQEIWEFPAFNVADSSITVGAILLLLDSLLESRRKAATPTGQPPTAQPPP
jgi:signal peptidase II